MIKFKSTTLAASVLGLSLCISGAAFATIPGAAQPAADGESGQPAPDGANPPIAEAKASQTEEFRQLWGKFENDWAAFQRVLWHNPEVQAANQEIYTIEFSEIPTIMGACNEFAQNSEERKPCASAYATVMVSLWQVEKTIYDALGDLDVRVYSEYSDLLAMDRNQALSDFSALKAMDRDQEPSSEEFYSAFDNLTDAVTDADAILARQMNQEIPTIALRGLSPGKQIFEEVSDGELHLRAYGEADIEGDIYRRAYYAAENGRYWFGMGDPPL